MTVSTILVRAFGGFCVFCEEWATPGWEWPGVLQALPEGGDVGGFPAGLCCVGLEAAVGGAAVRDLVACLVTPARLPCSPRWRGRSRSWAGGRCALDVEDE